MSGRRRSPRFDPVAVIEAIYQLAGDERTWLGHVVEAAGRALDAGLGVFGGTYRLEEGGRLLLTDCWVGWNIEPAVIDRILVLSRELPGQDVERILLTKPVSTLSMLYGKPPLEVPALAFQARELGPDCFGMVARDPGGVSAVVAASLPTVRRLDAATVALWSRVAAHIAAGLRIRRRLAETSPDRRGLDSADAVLEPGGKIAHLGSGATSMAARAALREAAVNIDRARGVLRRRHPSEAVDIWQALVGGTWSFNEHFDHDGRRYFVARENQPRSAMYRVISPAERHIVGYAMLGHSSKLIAYELGISESMVSQTLKKVARRLGAQSRLELVAMLASSPREPAGQGVPRDGPPREAPKREHIGRGVEEMAQSSSRADPSPHHRRQPKPRRKST